MGALADALQAEKPSRGGPPSAWPLMVKALPADALEDVLAAFLDESVRVAQIKRIVEREYPDVPVMCAGTWRNWAVAHRAGNLV